MSKSSQDPPAISSGGEKDSPKRLGARSAVAPSSRSDKLTQDLIGSMKRLSRDELRYKKIAKKIF